MFGMNINESKTEEKATRARDKSRETLELYAIKNVLRDSFLGVSFFGVCRDCRSGVEM